MNSTKLIAFALIVVGLVVGYFGINTIVANTESFNFLGIKIDVSDESGKLKGILYTGLGVILLIGGIFTLNKSK